MAERKPLVNVSGVVNEITSSDTIPAANLPAMVGDSGAGGTKGAVPAPSAGDAAAGKFLKADGTFAVPSGGTTYFTWNTSASTSISASVNNAYVLTHTSLQTVTLPTTAAVGDRIKLVGVGSGKWKVAQNASESIGFGNALSTTSGTGGYLQSSDQNATVELVCVTANDTWVVCESTGKITSDNGYVVSECPASSPKMYQSWGFETSARYLANQNLSGETKTYDTYGVLLATSATANSGIRISGQPESATGTTWGSKNVTFSAVVNIPTAGTEYEAFVGWGGIDQGSTFVDQMARYVGLLITKISGTTTCYLATSDNSTATKTSFTGITVGTSFKLTIVYSTSAVRLYVDGVLKATNTTGIPTTFVYNLFRAAVRNRASATNTELRIGYASAIYDLF